LSFSFHLVLPSDYRPQFRSSEWKLG